MHPLINHFIPNLQKKEIEERLVKLIILNKIWLGEESSFDHPVKPLPSVVKPNDPKIPIGKEHSKVSVIPHEVEPIYSTKEEKDAFNAWYYKCISAKKLKAVTRVPSTSNPVPNDVILQTIHPAKHMVDKLRLPTVSKVMIDIPSTWQAYLNTVIMLMMSMPMFLKTSFLLFHPLPALTPTPSPPPASCSDHYGHACPLPGTSYATRQRLPVTYLDSGWGLETLDFNEKQEKRFSSLNRNSGFQPCYSEQDFSV